MRGFVLAVVLLVFFCAYVESVALAGDGVADTGENALRKGGKRGCAGEECTDTARCCSGYVCVLESPGTSAWCKKKSKCSSNADGDCQKSKKGRGCNASDECCSGKCKFFPPNPSVGPRPYQGACA